jgi:hypothetical protein
MEMSNTPQWLSNVEVLTFLALVATMLYNRLVSWKKFHERTSKLEISFDQYQKDVQAFFKSCEVCRGEVRLHHEDALKHVTPSLQQQINRMADSIDEIKSILMTRNQQ